MSAQGTFAENNPINEQQVNSRKVAPKGAAAQQENGATKTGSSNSCCLWSGIAGCILVVVAAVVVVLFLFVLNEDDGGDSGSGTDFETALEGSCPGNTATAVLESDASATHYVSTSFVLESGTASCSGSSGIRTAYQTLLASSSATARRNLRSLQSDTAPRYVQVNVPADDEVVIVGVFSSEAAATAAETALGTPESITALSASIEASGDGITVSQSDVVTESGVVDFSDTVEDDEADDDAPVTDDQGQSTDDQAAQDDPTLGPSPSPAPVFNTPGSSAQFATSFQPGVEMMEMLPVGSGKAAVLVMQNFLLHWSAFDTAQGTLEIEDLMLDPDLAQGQSINYEANSVPPYFVSDGSKVYFSGQSLNSSTGATTGFELHSYDGETIELVADLRPGSEASNPVAFSAFEGKIIFSGKMDQNPNLAPTDLFSTFLVYDPVADTVTHPYPVDSQNTFTRLREYQQPGSAFNGTFYFAMGNDFYSYDGNVVSRVFGISSGLIFPFENRLLAANAGGTFEINTATNGAQNIDTARMIYRAFSVSNGQYLVGGVRFNDPANFGQQSFHLGRMRADNTTMQFIQQLADGVSIQQAIGYNDEYYYCQFTSGAASNPMFKYNGLTLAPEAINHPGAYFGTGAGDTLQAYTVTPRGMYFKPTTGQSYSFISSQPQPPQNFTVVRPTSGNIEVLDLGTAATGDVVYEAHGKDYILGQVSHGGGTNGVILELM